MEICHFSTRLWMTAHGRAVNQPNHRSVTMRNLNNNELCLVSGGEPEPLVSDPQSWLGGLANDSLELYINFLDIYIFPYIYNCM